MKQLYKLDVWQIANSVARDAYRLTLTDQLKRHFGLSDQIRRAAISIPANLAEGYALSTTKQLIRGARISLGSAAELRCHIAFAKDLELRASGDADTLLAGLDRLASVLIGLLKGLGAQLPK